MAIGFDDRAAAAAAPTTTATTRQPPTDRPTNCKRRIKQHAANSFIFPSCLYFKAPLCKYCSLDVIPPWCALPYACLYLTHSVLGAHYYGVELCVAATRTHSLTQPPTLYCKYVCTLLYECMSVLPYYLWSSLDFLPQCHIWTGKSAE